MYTIAYRAVCIGSVNIYIIRYLYIYIRYILANFAV